MGDQALFSCADISMGFGGALVLDDVSLEVDRGEILGLIGPNGSGKTTLINVISGFYRPVSGSITLDGQSLLGRRPQEIRKLGVGRTFQNLRLFDELTVLENTLFGLHPNFCEGGRLAWMKAALGMPSARRQEADAKQSALAALGSVGLAEIAPKKVGGLPYGVRKRLELARILVGEPKVLLLDEPMAGLVQYEIEEMMQLIERELARRDVAVLLVEHHLELVLKFSSRVVVLDAGRKISEGEPAIVAKDPHVAAAYVGGIGEA